MIKRVLNSHRPPVGPARRTHNGAAGAADPTGHLCLDVDRTSPTPLYRQISMQIERAICIGTLQPGDRLEPEIALAARLGLSRLTTRQAMQELVDKGIVVRKRGVGTVVVHGQINRPLRLSSLYEDLKVCDDNPRTRVLLNAVEPAPVGVAAALTVAPGSAVLHLRRLRFARGAPLAIMENYLPQQLLAVGDADLEHVSLYEVLHVHGVQPSMAKQRIGARDPTTDESALLDMDDGPVLTMHRVVHDDRGVAIEFAQHVFRSDRQTFDIVMVAAS
jgi:DNA-binding GntR family transcriptional regulator